MSTNTKRLLVAISIMVVAAIGSDEKSHALKYPHASPNVTQCSNCHSRAQFKTITSFNNLCFNTVIGCHRSSGMAPKKVLNTRNASNRFGSLPANWSTIKQVSHGWKIPNTNPDAGVPAGNAGLVGLGGSETSRAKGKIFCTRCHRAMGTAVGHVIYDKFLRADPTGNYVCFQCHSARRTDNAREPLQAGFDYSHPVEVNYSTARAAKPTFFETTPQLASAFGYKTSASVRLYTTHNTAQGPSIAGSSRLAGTNRGAVVCQTCHGPIHSADSNPYTFDNLSAYSRLGTYSASQGSLLRMYPIAGPKASNNLCLSCHKVQSHMSFMCGRCHAPHKKPGETNRYLILENISTPYNGIRSVVFTSRSAMAARFGGYSKAFPRLDKVNRPVSNRICQVCHTGRTTGKAITHHRNYSSPSGTVDRTHNMRDQGDASQGYFFCPQCHKHTSGFVPSGCSTCHNFPPSDTISATDSFKHAKHTNESVEPIPTDTFWKTGRVTDNRSDSSYGFSCGRCHSPWGPYTATYGDGYQGKNHYYGNGGITDLNMAAKNYTTEVGFKIKTSINTLPWNPLGSYASNNIGRALDPGASGTTKWWGAGTGATCSNLYCHGQWYNGYTSNNPNARGTQACGKCHGASNTDPPGKTNGVNYGAHPRHVGSVNSQQYGSGTPNFRCNACHSRTSKYNNETTVNSRKYHVNGRVNIKFDNGSSSNFRVGNTNSNYGGGVYNDYTSRRPAMFTRPAYTTCKLIYCHSMGNRLQGNYSAPNNASIGSGPARFPNWSSSKNFTTTMSIGGYTMKTRCARCHGNTAYKGITMAMPNYTSNQYGGAKENSHRKHVIENKFRCNICHSSTINSANNSIASTRNHVNRFYNISIISTYRDSGVGNNYDNSSKTCSSVTCHAGKTTPAWGSKIGCADCHLNNARDYDKRIINKQAFQNFSETAPKIYSGAWADSGHGRQAASGNYYGKDSEGNNNGNPAANRTCTNCHKASVPHNTASNPFRLYTTHSGNPNALCEDCHGLNPGNSNKATNPQALDIQTHSSTVVGSKKYNFAMKCIDCHDPHGDNNILMIHSSVARPRITAGTRRELSDQYGRLLTNITTRNIDFVDNQYTSNYARKYLAARICQNCHTQTKDVSPPYGGRFRWYSAADKTHGGAKCTVCHTHATGFKGAGCDACHGWPPRSASTLIGRPGTNQADPMSGSTTAGAHLKHYTTFYNMPGIASKTAVCGLCHQGGMYPNGAKNDNIDLRFGLLGVYTTGTYNGQSLVGSGFYGYSGKGAGTANDNKRCSNVKCHGGGNWLSASYGTPTAPKWDNPNTARCGKCHGAKKAAGQGSWPTSMRHRKHAGTATGAGGEYDLMCKVCHSATVMNTATTLSYNDAHVNGKATFLFYTGAFTGNRVWSGSSYNGDDVVNSGWGACLNLYCHSRGTTTSPSYTGSAFPNYTARWDTDLVAKFPSDQNKRCSFCHGNRTYNGITAAMPNYSTGTPKENSHRKHVVVSGLRCNFCHSATIKNTNDGIANTNNHVNKFYNITILGLFKSGQTNYSTTVSAKKTCKNVRCHGGKTTPRWGSNIICQNCHLSASTDTDDFTFNNYSRTIAQIYSSDWTKRGHGKSRSSGRYPFSNNSGAAKGCTNCHKPEIKHGDQNNYFRLMTSNPDRLCLACHGRGSERIPSMGFSLVTGIQSHTWYNISTAGYVENIRKATLYGGWNFGTHDGGDQKKVKCVDCHDPHGDNNNSMIHSYLNMSGSDRVGRPTYSLANAQAIFTAVGGPQMNWSSYVRPLSGTLGICQRCHSPMSNSTAMTNFNKGKYSGHNAGSRCTVCHKHNIGFKPSGCEGCHGYPPPKGPGSWKDSMTGYSSLHTPHAINPRFRPISGRGSKFGNDNAWGCEYCHGDAAAPVGMGNYPDVAILENMTSQTGYNGYNLRVKFTSTVNGAVADDKCRSVWCHTPRAYQRQWRKPTDCDDCHGYRNRANGETFNIQTTGSHKTHVNYSTPTIAGTDSKKYGFRCTQCHVDNGNNYSTHYTRRVDINFKTFTYNNSTAAVYSRGTAFKGFTTGQEFGTCSKVYCHGRFSGGTTITQPRWGNKFTGCSNCHRSKTNAASMPGAHPLHVKPVASSGYEFVCSRCHARTIVQGSISSLMWNYSAHVNKRKDIYFDTFNNNNGGTLDSVGNKCKNTYCHSSGYRPSPASSFTTRTTLSNWTASWGDGDRNAKTENRPCSYCHGNRIYRGITAAMPNQTSLWGNSHRTHVIRNNFRCSVCHSATVSSAGVINNAAGNHVNSFKNVTIIAMYKSGQTLYSSQMPSVNKSCKNVKCHAGKTTPKWGTSATCKNCHFVATGSDTDDYANFRSFTGTAARIYSTEWASKGHGSVGKNIQCTDCHRALAPHNGRDSSGNMRNPYRLLTSQSNAVCGNCHGSAAERNAFGGEIASIYQGIKPHTKTATGGNASWNTHSTVGGRGVKCVDCHDPHGDKNKKMVHALINMSGSDRFGRPKGRPWADGADSTVTAQMTFTSFNGQIVWSSFASQNLSRSICRRCHTPVTQDTGMGNDPASNPGNMTKGNYADTHQTSHTSKCTSCHTHANGFKGGACNGCHGYPPTGTFNLLSGLNRSNEIKQRSSGNIDRPGGHGRHTSVLLPGTPGGNDLKAVCSYCHSGGMADTSNDDDDITLKFSAFGYYTGANQKYKGAAAVRDGFYGYSGTGAGTADGSFRCETVKCHGAKGNWLTKSFGNVTTPRWNDNTRNSVFCGSCHGTKKAANKGTWPTTNAHTFHAGTSIRQQDLMCKTCHSITVLNTATTLNKAKHVDGNVYVNFSGASDTYNRVDKRGTYSGDTLVNINFGKCANIYCHSKGTDRVAPYSANTAYANWTARWDDTRGGYKKANGQKAKCNYCHGSSLSGVTSAMPNYPDNSPKANKHPKHVREYGFLCGNCHVNIVANNTSIQGGNYNNHVNRVYNVDLGGTATNSRSIDNSQGRYTSTNSGCRGTYCHSRGTKFNSAPYTNTTALANYTAHWGDSRGSWKQPKANMAKCNYCHGSRNTYSGMTSAMPIYNSGSPKANRHPMHVVNYGFTCTVCHEYVTSNNTSIDASGGMDRHVNQSYNVDFKKSVRNGFTNNTGSYTYQASIGGGVGSKCKNTYCHSRGTDTVAPFNTRTSFANWTARWGDTRGGYKQANGLKAKCNYCHGNRAFSGMTSAMPNYTSAATTNTAKWNTHPIHVRSYGFTCNVCHVKVVANNTSISDSSLHVNQAYNVNFKANVRGNLTNNTGVYSYTDQTTKNKCKNTYCHSRGTDFTAPFNTRTSFANWTARWGDTRGGYRPAAIGQKARCNYCHGNRLFGGITAAMPNYSGNVGFSKAKANSHRAHVIDNGFVCSTCHYGVVPNNTSISDRVSHVNGFYNISITPAQKNAGKGYSSVYGPSGGFCMNNKCHGASKPQWGNPSTANCRVCHYNSGSSDIDDYATPLNSIKAEIYSSEWKKKGHGQFKEFTSTNANTIRCLRCHKSSVGHNTNSNPFRLATSESVSLCLGCHGTLTERGASWNVAATNVDYKTHTKDATGGDAGWNTHTTVKGRGVKCIDCHDPHGDKNKKMIHALINMSGSDRFGRPKGRPWADGANSAATAQMTFTTHNGQFIWSSFANNNISRSICRRCHTPNPPDTNMGNKPPSPAPGEMTKDNYAASHQLHSATCTAACHTHKSGFKGGGESTGDSDCRGCHGTGNLFEAMQAQNNYHHVMMTASAVGSTKYPNKTSFSGSAADQRSSARRCLMCHVDHNVFRPDINDDGTGGRAKNLRWSVLAQGNKTGINTDFWPAKRKNAVRTGVDSGTANYSSTYPVKGPTQYNGVCISCHKNIQYKNTTLVNDDIGTSRARPFSVALYTSSSHNFQVISGVFVFGTGGRSSFRGNCVKCHRTPNPNGNYDSLSKPEAQQGYGMFPVALHDKNVPSLLMNIITSSNKPQIEQLCYNCHSTKTRSSGGPGRQYDYYSSIKMGSGPKLIKTAIEGKTSGHPVDDVSMAGVHKIDEFYNATSASSPGSPGYPNYGWNRPGRNRHSECVDCHNTHGGNATIKRDVGSQNGNQIAGAQKGVWGVQLVYSASGFKAKAGQRPRYQKVSQVTYQYEVCMKCHSGYAYYTSLPDTPSGGIDMSLVHVAGSTYDTVAAGISETDISMDFNPDNAAYHPVIRKGRNQPPHTANSAWPAGGTRKYFAGYSAPIGNVTADIKFQGVSGLGWTFVPPFSQKSTLACSDCHQADNTGNAVQDSSTASIVSETGTWTWTYAPGHSGDKVYVLGTKDSGEGNLRTPIVTTSLVEYNPSVSDPGGNPPVQFVYAVVIAKSDTGTTNNRKLSLQPYNGATAGTLVTTVALATSYSRIEADLSASQAILCGTWTWACLDNLSVQIKNTSTGTAKNIDWAGIAGGYAAAGDMRGPHGSLSKWILTDVDTKVLFDADRNNSVVRDAVGGPTFDNINGDLDTEAERRWFCFNCHRRDVYGYDAETGSRYQAYSRLSHPANGTAAHNAPEENVWGIGCRNCHGGRGSGKYNKSTGLADLNASGGIHGIRFRTNTAWGATQGRAAASFKLLNRPFGTRLLFGATQLAFADASTVYCYTLAADDALGGCTAENGSWNGTAYSVSAGQSIGLNYSYTASW